MDRVDNIKHKVYFAEFGQSESVYFTINETSNKQVVIYIIWSQCYINTQVLRKCLHKVFTLHIRYINPEYIGVARGP